MKNEIALPSGVKLCILDIPFDDAHNLFMAVNEEAMRVRINPSDEVDVNMIKDVLCLGLSSKKIDELAWLCMARCTYGGVKITKETFEPMNARADFVLVKKHVIEETCAPFVSGLSAGFSLLWEKVKLVLA